MTEDERAVREALKHAFPAVDTQLPRDLWPSVLRKLDADHISVPWYDWVLMGLSAGALLFFPQLILVMVYHF